MALLWKIKDALGAAELNLLEKMNMVFYVWINANCVRENGNVCMDLVLEYAVFLRTLRLDYIVTKGCKGGRTTVYFHYFIFRNKKREIVM